MTNTESKVVACQWRSPHMIAANEPPNVTGDEALIAKVNGQGWEVEGLVTHADYRALKERYEALKVTEREGYAEYHRTRVELASIKARAAEDAEDAEDAERWREFIRCGWPVCFLGETYDNAADLNAAVDNARKEPK